MHEHMTHPRRWKLSPVCEQLLSRHCGSGDTPVSAADLAGLARAVGTLADAYTDGEPARAVLSDPELRTAYGAYYLPCNAVKLFPVLHEIQRRTPLLRPADTLRVLDIGCGPGTLMLGLLDYCFQNHANDAIRLALTGIDREPGNIAAARALVEGFSAAAGAPALSSLDLLTGEVSAPEERFPDLPHDAFDLIMAGNLVNELPPGRIAPFARQLNALLKPGGMLIILDPGTQRSFRQLLSLRHELLSLEEIRLVAPCLQAGACPLQHSSNAWCHDKVFWSPPGLVRLVDERTGFTKHKGVKFSYLVATRISGTTAGARTEVPNQSLWRVISYVIRSKGEERLYVCNGRERRLLRRLTRLHTAANADFSCCARGDIVTIAGAEQRTGFFNIGPAAVFRIIS